MVRRTGVRCQVSGVRLMLSGLVLLLAPGAWHLAPAFAQQPQAQQAQPLSALNAKYVNGVAPGYWPTAGTGLTLNLSAGTSVCGNSPVSYAGGTLTMTASATNYVFLDMTNNCTPAFTSGGSSFPATGVPIAVVTTSSSVITAISDVRSWFAARPVVDPGGQVYNVKSFGAKCDGTTDDTAAIQATESAIQKQALTVPSSGVILIPGTCAISNTIILSGILHGTGWGLTTNTGGSQSALKWIGSAGIPMVEINTYGAGIEDLRLIGNSSARPSDAIVLNRVSPGVAGKGAALKNIYIGNYAGWDSDNNAQFVNGITWAGTVGDDSWTLENIRCEQVTGVCINQPNPNASDVHINGLFVDSSGTAVLARGWMSITNFLGTLNGLDFDLSGGPTSTNGHVNVRNYVSESAGRMAIIVDAKLEVSQGSFQITNALTDNMVIKAAGVDFATVDLDNFGWFYTGSYTGSTPVIQFANTTYGDVRDHYLHLHNTYGMGGPNIVAQSLGDEDAYKSTIVQHEGASNSWPVPPINAMNILGPGQGYDDWRYDHPGKVNVYGGPHTVGQLSPPNSGFPTAGHVGCVPVGGGATTYAYQVVANSGVGHTNALTQATCTNAATLNSSNYNIVWWNPILGADSYSVYGRTSGSEQFLATVTPYSVIYNSGISPYGTGLGYTDNGTATPTGSGPPLNNTTGGEIVQGPFSNGVATTTNTDNRGKITLSGGTGSYTFTQGPGTGGAWTTAPICIVQDDTNPSNLTGKTVTASTLSVTASGASDIVSYLCSLGN